MKLSLFAGLLLLATAAFTADADLNDAKSWNGGKNPEPGILEFQGPGKFDAKAAKFKVDPNTKYRISGEIRQAPGATSTLFLTGFTLLDKDQQVIMPVHIRVIKGTKTQLTEDAKAGATTIKVKNAVRWPKKDLNPAVAFNAGTYPNRDLADYVDAKKEGTAWVITLKAPLKKDYKAGTKVCVQAPGAYFYAANVQKPKEEWVKFSGIIQGIPAEETKNQFWPGTVYAVPMILINWNWGPDNKKFKSQIRNFKVEIVK